MSKDTFWTIGYKGHYIHGHRDRDLKCEVIEVQWMLPDGSFKMYKAKPLHGAKCRITRVLTSKLKSKLQELEPAMKCGNRTEFQQRLAWLSEGTLKFHLSDGRMPYKQDQAEIDLYLSYKRNFV